MKAINAIRMGGVEVLPLVEGGKGISVSNGNSSGARHQRFTLRLKGESSICGQQHDGERTRSEPAATDIACRGKHVCGEIGAERGKRRNIAAIARV